jgi:hypothetical protein
MVNTPFQDLFPAKMIAPKATFLNRVRLAKVVTLGSLAHLSELQSVTRVLPGVTPLVLSSLSVRCVQ